MVFKSPKDTYEAIIAVGTAKSNNRIDRIFIQGIMAGAYIAFGGLLAIMVGGGMDGIKLATYNMPGIQKLVYGGVFPVGLMAVIFTGAELFTGNCMCLIPPLMAGKAKWYNWLKNWFFSYIGNIIGAMLVAFLFVYVTNAFPSGSQQATFAIAVASGKCTSWWFLLLVKAIACNWLVCLAVWQAIAASDASSKIWAIWWPIMAFVAIGYEHSIANAFFGPAGIWILPAYSTTVNLWTFFYRNLIPVTIGNIIGGSFFMGMLYWYVFGTDKFFEWLHENFVSHVPKPQKKTGDSSDSDSDSDSSSSGSSSSSSEEEKEEKKEEDN